MWGFFILKEYLFYMNIECKLMCASGAAGSISVSDKNGKYNPCGDDNKQYNAIEFVEDPYVVIAGPEEIEAALVGKTDSEIIVAFRGTLPPTGSTASILDWLQDFVAMPVPNKHLKGKVHLGFMFAFMQLKSGICDAIKSLDGDSNLPIYITGHSKGGGIAPIAAMYLKNLGLNIVDVITFAGPNPGDYEFYESFKETFPKALRYENHLDIVPLLPPVKESIDIIEKIPPLPKEFISLLEDTKKWGYHPVGSLNYINSNDEVESLTPTEASIMLPIRLMEIAVKAEVTGSLSFLGDAHNGYCYHGYMQGVCQDKVCLLLND
jgi:hypothetical protein